MTSHTAAEHAAAGSAPAADHAPRPAAYLRRALGSPIGLRQARAIGLAAVALSLSTSLVLLGLYRELGGPGDPIYYYRQAERLLPFTHEYYGPVYFATIRLVRDVLGLEWFVAGKMTSWASACVFLALCHLLLRPLLGATTAWLALALIALNPTFIGQAYSALTTMLGATWLLVAVVLTLRVPAGRPVSWFVPGVIFGVAYLTRFQATGFLLGAALGALLLPAVTFGRRAAAALLLLAGAAAPVVMWRAFLLWQQGFVPPNHNFVHLAVALGQFSSFADVPVLTDRYGSLWGLLQSDRWAVVKLAAFAAKEALKFPFGVAFGLLFIAAGWLLPGLFRVASQRHAYAPWSGAFLVGLVLTGIGSRGWLHYYVAFLPFLAVLVASAVGGTRDLALAGLTRASWLVLLTTTAAWSAVRVHGDLLDRNWTEFTVARRYIEAARVPGATVATSTATIGYRSRFGIVELSEILRPSEIDQLVPTLRRHGVTHLLITERHTLFNYPQLAPLLADTVRSVPAGLRRDTLIVSPRRLAIYRIVSPTDSTP